MARKATGRPVGRPVGKARTKAELQADAGRPGRPAGEPKVRMRITMGARALEVIGNKYADPMKRIAAIAEIEARRIEKLASR